ncbi:MAG TPA: hypothetical protein VIY47_01355, partial [Ignavibacteriaceae bacterium]
MFTQQEFQKVSTECFASIPKTPDDVKELMNKVKTVYTKEAKKVAEVIKTYQKAVVGDASPNEIAVANKQ